jgi:hypothetical protein
MARHWRAGSVLLWAVALLAPDPPIEVCRLSFGQELSQDAKAALEERDRLWAETQKLSGEGKIAEAIAAAEAMLAIERKVLPAGHADLIISLDWLTRLHLAREDFAAAKAARTKKR